VLARKSELEARAPFVTVWVINDAGVDLDMIDIEKLALEEPRSTVKDSLR
jgi:hypothetical protein